METAERIARQAERLFSTEDLMIFALVAACILIMPFFVFCSLLDVTGGAVRGLGRSFQIMLVSLFGACGLRLIWVFCFLPMRRTLPFLYVSYPLSWGIIFAVAAGLFLFLTRPQRLRKEYAA